MSKFYRWIISEFNEEWYIRANTLRDSMNRVASLAIEDFKVDYNEVELEWNDKKDFGYVFFNNFPINTRYLAG